MISAVEKEWQERQNYIDKLETAIRKHRDQKGDDRCWMDDEELYKVLPEGYTVPDRAVGIELDNCRQYLVCRQNPDTTYISPQRRIEELEAENRELKKRISETIVEIVRSDIK